MTSPFTTEDRTESVFEWFQSHSREAGWAAVFVVAIGAGGWFYLRSKDLKNTRAERAYFEAQRSVAAGNLPLAESDLRKMVERYDGTPSAIEGRLQLAQVLYQQGKFQQGVDELKKKEDDIGSDAAFGSSVHTVIAGGLEQLKKFREAAAEYEAAAKAARFDSDRQRYLALAATAYATAGDTAKSKQMWTDLGKDSKGTVAGEARVRLGELEAKPQPRS
jgi:predicted negative regulator of RcsB-dependent stress response